MFSLMLWFNQRDCKEFFFVAVFVTIGVDRSNITGATAYWPAGSPEKVPTFLLPLMREDCCPRRRWRRTVLWKSCSIFL
jgi:hypothetical protein